MTPEQQRAVLEAAAKVCELAHVDYSDSDYDGSHGLMLVGSNGEHARSWNPINNSADTGWMCAKLNINTRFSTYLRDKVECWIDDQNDKKIFRHIVPHDGTPESREAAQRLAATMVAAKIGGYTDDI